MACDVRILPTAEREVAEIVEYLVARSKSAARSFVAEYQHLLELLAEGTVEFALSRMPELARLGYRTCAVGAYVVLYYRDGGNAVIAHVFHASRDYTWLVRHDDGGPS